MDISVQNEGTIVLLRPNSDAAKEWIAEHIPDDALYFGDALAVEWRFASDIIAGMRADGLDVE